VYSYFDVGDGGVRLTEKGRRTSIRRYELDWLRAIAVFTVLIYHGSQMFALVTGGPIRNSELSVGFDALIVLLGGFGMPLFFTISGMSTFYALNIVDGLTFLKYRVTQLLVPFVAGLFTYLPLQLYVSDVHFGLFTGSFPEYYSGYVNWMITADRRFPRWGGHLWFLPLLFAFTVLTLKPFRELKKTEYREMISRISRFFRKPLSLYLPFIPVLIGEIIDPLTRFGLTRATGWSFLGYFFYFVYGFFFVYDENFETSLDSHGVSALLIAVFFALIGLPLFRVLNLDPVIYPILGIYGWSTLIVALNIGRRYLSFNHRWLRSINEMGLPFYAIHQPVIIIVGFYVVQTGLPMVAKFILTCAASAIITIGLASFVRRVNILRPLFGLRIRRRS
jgi:peptidoglycan/LPS O-acetylase OafA/YrhL